jgi:hypothetical protein
MLLGAKHGRCRPCAHRRTADGLQTAAKRLETRAAGCEEDETDGWRYSRGRDFTMLGTSGGVVEPLDVRTAALHHLASSFGGEVAPCFDSRR